MHIVVTTCDGKGPLGDIYMVRMVMLIWVFEEDSYEDLNWIQLAQDQSPMVGICEHANVSDFNKQHEISWTV